MIAALGAAYRNRTLVEGNIRPDRGGGAYGTCPPQGTRLEDYAVCNDLALPTVKTQLRGIFAKTTTSRQAELVRLITEIPAIREQ